MAVFFGLWPLGFILDARITIKKSHLIPKHEINVIFPTLCSRFGLRGGCFIQLLLEAVVVIFLPPLFMDTLDVAASSAVSATLGASHAFAFYSNRRIPL
jgi:hypothetical protein